MLSQRRVPMGRYEELRAAFEAQDDELSVTPGSRKTAEHLVTGRVVVKRAMGRYEELRAAFEAQDDGLSVTPGSRNTAEHVVTGPAFVKELALLADYTGDVRFLGALEAIAEKQLVDARLRWRRDLAHHVFVPSYKATEDAIFVAVEEAIEDGRTRRVAFAEAVVEIGIKAQSFDAAVKFVERLWRRYRRAGIRADELQWTHGAGECGAESNRNTMMHERLAEIGLIKRDQKQRRLTSHKVMSKFHDNADDELFSELE
jgi:hypothetical protein